ncbi:MAG: thioredoxin domain-containing protein [Saprospiraceae bacterium]|nr:thioredoxin domain-containing protein [Saprospiraceae bacterium]
MKKATYLLFTMWILSLYSCSGQPKQTQNEAYEFTNELIHERSPYLLQHAHNPVNWQPWGEKAFQKAREENKLVIISIGYAACHWCHVMEHESFEDIDVANYMNEHFICIKVDREERPDVDQIYMTAAQLMTGRGGWPLNALALPDGKPFYAGTYFPKKSWLDMLNYFVDIQSKDPNSINDQAQKVTDGIRSAEQVTFAQDKPIASITDIHKLFDQWKTTIDFEKGGEQGAPKFPLPSNWEYLLQYHYLTHDSNALNAVTVTLDNMASGGIYDQLGGGFARYSTDEDWKAPHFEKMLYDNAQLVSLYSHAYQVTKIPVYKKVVLETLDFIKTELSAPDGGFYSSLDADSEGEEGKYYVWTTEEINAILTAEAPLFIDYYNLTRSGNWEDQKNILLRKPQDEKLVKKYAISIEEMHRRIEQAKAKVMAVRSKRLKPRLDDKILTSWNALMVKGYIDAYRAFGDKEYREEAIRQANYIFKNTVLKNFEILRSNNGDHSSIYGFLDDYAFTISTCIALYQVTFDELWLHRAKDISDYTLIHFFDHESGMFFYTNGQYADLIARKMEVADNVIPSSNSAMAKNLLLLGLYFDHDAYIQTARQMILNVQEDMHQNIRYYSNWGSVELLLIQPPTEVAILGPDFEQFRMKLNEYFLPHSILLGGDQEGSLPLLENKLVPERTIIYVCQDKVCKLPTISVEEALKQIN